MSMKDFAKFIQKTLSAYHSLNINTCEELANSTEIITFKKNDIFEKEDSQVVYEFVLLEGIVRAFANNLEGEEITANFYTSGMAITPILMRSHDKIAFYNLQVISKHAKLMAFNSQKMFETMHGYLDLRQFGFNVIMASSVFNAEREIELLKSTGKQKLEWFRRKFPKLENEIQHYYIASFLGLTTTSLSRIRADK